MADFQNIKIADIDRRPEAQIRQQTNPQAVKDYAGLIKDGTEFEPIQIVQFDDGSNVLADGWHRVEAYAKAGYDKVKAVITQGGMAEVLQISLERNTRHGEKLTRQEKQGAIKKLLAIPEMRRKADKILAKVAGVSPALIAKMRPVVAAKAAAKKEPVVVGTPAAVEASVPSKQKAPEVVKETVTRSVTVHERKPENAKPAKMETFAEKVGLVKTWMKQGYLDFSAIISATETKEHRLVLLPKGPIAVEVYSGDTNMSGFEGAVLSIEGGKIRITTPKGTLDAKEEVAA